jgi:hypothetical protein
MNFEAGDIVSLNGDGRRLIIVSRLDSRLFWVRLVEPQSLATSGDMYAFRAQDLRLIARCEPQRTMSLVPQIARAPDEAAVIAA